MKSFDSNHWSSTKEDSEAEEWKFETSGLDGNSRLFGVNIFDYDWRRTGETASVVDPHYGQPRRFHVYEVEINGQLLRFAAGEFSNGVWGFFLRNAE